jgi:hypothetical protein
MGLTASEDNYTIQIFINCSNIHYLLRGIYGLYMGHTFQPFQLFDTFDIKLCANTRF